MKKTKNSPTQDVLSVFSEIWKQHGEIFLDYEAALAKNTARPRVSGRKVFRGICDVLWMGGSWRAGAKYGISKSVLNDYFLRWPRAGLFQT